MAMFAPIPLPPADNPQFKDVMDYLQKQQENRATQQMEAAKLAENKRQFGQKMDLLRAKLAAQQSGAGGGKKLSSQEKSQSMKLLDAGRNTIGLLNKTNELEKILSENPHLTGWLPHLKNMIGKGGEELGKFTTNAAELQAILGKLASQRGGAQIIKWAEKMKPSDFKDVMTNLGNVRGMRETATSDFGDIADEYEAITGEKFPLKIPQVSEKMVEIEDSKGNREKVTLSEARKRGVEGV